MLATIAFGDPEQYPESAIFIDVKRLFKTKHATPPSASSVVVRSGDVNTQSSHTLSGDVEMTDAQTDEYDSVKNSRTYTIKDPSYEKGGGRREVGYDDLARGYEYGRTIVPVSESDENVTIIDTYKSFSIIGFVPNDKV